MLTDKINNIITILQSTADVLKSVITEIMAMIVCMFLIVLPMIMWATQSYATIDHKLVDIPGSLIGFLSAAGTLFLGLFVHTRIQELKSNNTDTKT